MAEVAEVLENLEPFPLKEMDKRGWFEDLHEKSLIDTAKRFFLEFGGSRVTTTTFHRKKVRTGSDLNEEALFAWQVRAMQLVRKKELLEDGYPVCWEASWVPDLVKLSNKRDGPILARDFLWQKGIALVVERHLQGMHTDGAAWMSESGRPTIGLTLRHDRLDNFWFTLLHELGHVLLHLSKTSEYDFFDEEHETSDEFEKEADEFAQNMLIPKKKWDMCSSRFILSEDELIEDAREIEVHPAILAGRIRRDKNNYTLFHNQLGQNTVSYLFWNDNAE
ncbi:ImmA/IrrE family metallo-endopeptidase [Pseudovibrio ascidiaceicola]|uniref:ImmA/IrrE family metallo-endopeptidase n=1 Tax=Pseudovibrio ascidiaceicola TaxID=285279 RepID=UPI003D365E5A